MPEPMILCQARLGSTRLPRKVLADIWGKTMIERQHERMKLAGLPILYAIPDAPENDELERLCWARDWFVFRGPENDVLDRYARAADAADADPVIRTTADCPLIDPGVILGLLQAHRTRAGSLRFTTNNIEKTFPHGLDVEVFDRDLLKLANVEAVTPFEREHVSPWMRVNTKIADVVNVRSPAALGHIRITVDTEEDLARVREIYLAFRTRAFITTADIVWLFDRRPNL